MKKFTKFTGYFLLAAFFSVALSGCGKKTAADPNANKIVVWSFEDVEAWKPIIKSFKSDSKGYDIVYYKHELNANYEKDLLNSILSGQGPDVWAMPNDWLPRHKDKLVPMADAAAKTYNLDQYVPAVKDSVVIDSKIYGLAPSAEPLMVYYNPKLINNIKTEYLNQSKDKEFNKKVEKLLSNEPPSLWTDFTEAAKLLTKKNGDKIETSGLAMGTSNITSAADILYLLMLQNNTDIISAGEKVATFNLPKNISTGASDVPGKRALEFYTSFADPASGNQTWDDSLGNDIEAFANGKVAMMFGFSSLQNTFLQKYPSVGYRKAYVPQLIGDAGTMADFAKFNLFGVSKLSKNPSVAWSLVTKLAADYSDGLNSYSRLYTAKKSSNFNPNLTSADRTGTNPEKNSLVTAKSLVKGRYPEEFDQNLRDAIALLNSKKQDSQSALDLAASKSTELLRKEGW